MSEHDYEIRSLQVSDAEAALNYLKELKSEGLQTIFSGSVNVTLEQEKAWISAIVDHPGSFIFGAFYGPKLVALLDFQRLKNPQMSHSGEFGVGVLQKYRGRGLGTRLLERLFSALEVFPEIRRVELEVFSNNTGAIRLYEQLGFVIEGRKKESVVVGDGFVDLLQMVRFS